MKQLVMHIDSCAECPHCWKIKGGEKGGLCELCDMRTVSYKFILETIPDWCPLDDSLPNLKGVR